MSWGDLLGELKPPKPVNARRVEGIFLRADREERVIPISTKDMKAYQKLYRLTNAAELRLKARLRMRKLRR